MTRRSAGFGFSIYGCVVGLFLTSIGSSALASDTLIAEGSTPTHRPDVDLDLGEVYIYVGGTFPIGTQPTAFRYLFDATDAGNTTGYITPLLFERTSSGGSTIYTVVGVGRGIEVKLNSAPDTIPFDIIEGIKVTPGGNFTFGFINAIVNESGVPVATSPGTVDYDQPPDTGQGAGGASTTNRWVYTDYSTAPNPIVTLRTTFGPSGSSANYIFNLSRTYSATGYGVMQPQ